MSKRVINGLVLSGGKSSRYGSDKGEVNYHEEKDQRAFCFDALSNYCNEVFLSCRKNQYEDILNKYPYIIDMVDSIGPAGGLLSAYHHNPKAAWLAIACDMPLIDPILLEKLISERDPKAIATTYFHEKDVQIEPLVTIWEPEGLKQLARQVASHNYSLSKLLSCGKARLVPIQQALQFMNVNTKEDDKNARTILGF